MVFLFDHFILSRCSIKITQSILQGVWFVWPQRMPVFVVVVFSTSQKHKYSTEHSQFTYLLLLRLGWR